MERTENMTRAAAPAVELDRSYVDWPAVLAGGVVAVAVAAIFAAFGAALGLSTISAEPGEGSFNVMLIVTAVWIVVSLVASYLTGGYIAGRMRRRVDQAGADEVTVRDGINGLVVWGLGILTSVLLLSSVVSTRRSAVGSGAGAVATTVGSAVGGMVEGAATAAGALVPEAAVADPMAYVGNTLLRPAQVVAGTGSAEETARQTASILGNVAMTGEISEAERSYLVSAVIEATGATPAQANLRVDEAIAMAQQVHADAQVLAADAEGLANEASEAAIAAAEIARISTILTAFILAAASMVAGAAAYVGAVRGGRHRDEGRVFSGFAYRG